MNFFEHQAAAQRRTKLLVFYYAMAVAAIVVSVYLLVVIGLTASAGDEGAAVGLWQPVVFFWVAAIVGGVILCGSLFKISALSSGGKAVAETLGGQLIPANTTDPAERRLLNIVEEMAIASGVPVPPVYLLDEAGINAFAAGFKPSDAVIGVTRGCVEQLNRDELQGVVAHEFSHIINGDMRLDIRLMGILFGILLISVIGQTILRMGIYSGAGRRRSRNDKGGGGIIAFGIALMVVGYIGVFFGRLIKSAVSRQREFLADASAVQYTRNPHGIAGALKKIGGFAGGSQVKAAHAEEVSHMFFANGLRQVWFGMLATHPPLPERIRRIQADFNAMPTAAPPPVPASGKAGVSGFAGGATMSASAADFVDQIGTPDAKTLHHATNLIGLIPQRVREALHDADGAQAAVFCLLLSRETEAFNIQVKHLQERIPNSVLGLMEELHDAIGQLPFAARMPLLDLTLPALQQMDVKAYRTFRATIEELVAADRKVSIFEFALTRSLLRNLAPVFGKAERVTVRYRDLKPLLPHCLPLIALLARYGNEDNEPQALDDFQTGVGVLGYDASSLGMPAVGDNPVQVFESALTVLRQADGRLKKLVIAACATAVTANQKVTVEEAELLRAVADSLDCPIPPLAPTV